MKFLLGEKVKASMLAFLLVMMIQACDQYLPQEDATGSMSVSVLLEDAKITAPDLSADDFNFIINGDGPGDNTFHVETMQGAGSALVENLVFGTWNITVEALHHGTSGAVSFGDGTGTVEVHANSTSLCSVSIIPFEGQGVLRITVNWSSTSVEDPMLEGTLSRIGFDALAVPFTVGTGQATATMNLDSGIYTFSFVLKDGDVYEFSGAADSIRITNSLTTTAVYTLNGESGVGSIDISISISIPSSIDPVISGGAETISTGTSMALTASAPAETGQLYYSWYLNGRKKQDGASYTVPGTLAEGPYRVDLIVFNADYTRSGAATYLFTVTE